jgi:hypothetical protein
MSPARRSTTSAQNGKWCPAHPSQGRFELAARRTTIAGCAIRAAVHGSIELRVMKTLSEPGVTVAPQCAYLTRAAPCVFTCGSVDSRDGESVDAAVHARLREPGVDLDRHVVADLEVVILLKRGTKQSSLPGAVESSSDARVRHIS